MDARVTLQVAISGTDLSAQNFITLAQLDLVHDLALINGGPVDDDERDAVNAVDDLLRALKDEVLRMQATPHIMEEAPARG